MNKYSFCLMFFMMVAGAVAVEAADPADSRLMPLPAKITLAQGRLPIDRNFAVAVTGSRDPIVLKAATRLFTRLHRQTGIPFASNGATDGPSGTLEIRCEGRLSAVQKYREDESYRLEVNGQKAVLTAATPFGAFRGIETFLQLVDLDAEGYAAPAVQIDDQPRFPWRGLSLDVSRHFIPVAAVKRTLDGMAALKLNVLHWHLSDDQGFRIETRKYPKLHELASDGQYYSQAQVREVVEYARERGIRVMPEFDMPGHTSAWFAAYPQYRTASQPTKIEIEWGIFDPCMDPTKEELYTFLDGLIGEIAGLFPDEYFHIGGDEVNGKEWDQSPRVAQFKRAHGMKSNHDLQAYFNKRLLAIVTKHGKKMAGWDEILHPDLPKNIVVQSWRGQESLAASARQGYTGILSNGYYLDLGFPASRHYLVDPLGGDAANLSPEEKARILGGEACQWAEFVTPEVLDLKLYPRLAAVAERLWSPQEVKDIDSMYRRLAIVGRHLEFAGMRHRANQTLMYKRLAGDAPYGPVKVLGDIVEQVKEYERPSRRRYTSHDPLNRLVDTIWPESDAGREFNALVKQTLAGPAAKEQWTAIRSRLTMWQENDGKVQPILRASALLREHIELSQAVARVAGAGLEAVGYAESGRRAPAEWAKQQQEMLDAAAKPQGELLIMIVPGVRALVQAAAGQEAGANR